MWNLIKPEIYGRYFVTVENDKQQRYVLEATWLPELSNWRIEGCAPPSEGEPRVKVIAWHTMHPAPYTGAMCMKLDTQNGT